jgi:hypothetical protein
MFWPVPEAFGGTTAVLLGIDVEIEPMLARVTAPVLSTLNFELLPT